MMTRFSATLIAGILSLLACGDGARDTPPEQQQQSTAQDSVAQRPEQASPVTAAVRNARGRELGTLTLTDGPEGIGIAGQLTGLPPGEHGIHLHTTGRCDPPSFESAGGHWNPTNRQHGTGTPKGPHQGDLPNITVARDSSVKMVAITAGGTIGEAGGLFDEDGAAVVVHARRDDYKSQPAGDSGDRIGCGVIER